MTLTKKNFGNLGESVACRYLEKHGYKIIERNFRIRGGEIDIIALKDQTLIFIEVKTRYSRAFGLPEESITRRKIAFLIRAINFYVVYHPNAPKALRLDAVVIEFANQKTIQRIEHITNISM